MQDLKIKKPSQSLGTGIGLRAKYYEEILKTRPNIDWFEIISENFLTPSLHDEYYLNQILAHYPLVQHGVSLSIGSSSPLDFKYLKQLKNLIQRTKSPWVSDHLSWGQIEESHFHDLYPLPYTKEVVNYVAERARIVQDFLEVPFALENLSSYVTYKESSMPEWEFVAEIAEKANILLVLDINNIYVSSKNHKFDPRDYYSSIPLDRVVQIHLAGHQDMGDYILDSHDQKICDEVWDLYGEIYPKTNNASTLIEWDENLPPLHEILKEVEKAKCFQEEIQAVR